MCQRKNIFFPIFLRIVFLLVIRVLLFASFFSPASSHILSLPYSTSELKNYSILIFDVSSSIFHHQTRIVFLCKSQDYFVLSPFDMVLLELPSHQRAFVHDLELPTLEHDIYVLEPVAPYSIDFPSLPTAMILLINTILSCDLYASSSGEIGPLCSTTLISSGRLFISYCTPTQKLPSQYANLIMSSKKNSLVLLLEISTGRTYAFSS